MNFEELIERNRRRIESDGIKIYSMNGRHSFSTAKGRVAYFYKATQVHCFPAVVSEKHLYGELLKFREKLGLPLLQSS